MNEMIFFFQCFRCFNNETNLKKNYVDCCQNWNNWTLKKKKIIIIIREDINTNRP